MGRKRRIQIDLELAEISDALQNALGTNAEIPIRLIYQLKANPDVTLTSILEQLGVRERTATRWLKILKDEGFSAYAGRSWRSRSTSPESTLPASSPDLHSDDPISVTTLMTLLRQAPQSPDEGTWGGEMKAWIRKILPEVDKVGVSIVNNVNLFDPDKGSYGVVRSDYAYATPSGALEARGTTVREAAAETHWKRIYLKARASGLIASDDYHSPSGADFYYQYGGKREFIGCLVLLRSSKKTPLRRETMATFHLLEPLIASHMGTAVARFQVWNPFLSASNHALHRIDPDDVLTKSEKQVAFLHLTGESYLQIAKIMSIDKATVASHTTHILKKLGFESVKEMMAKAHSSKGLWESKR